MTILHLADTAADYQTEAAIDQLTRSAGEQRMDVRRIGHGGDYSNAVAAILKLRRSRERFDFTHAWGEAALNAAAVGIGGKIVYTPTAFPTRNSIRWLRSVMAYRDVQIVCPTDTLRRAMVERGVPIERCHIVRPGVDFSSVHRRRDQALRSALGFADDDFVMLAIGESTRAADHKLVLWAGAILHVLDPRYRVLLWDRGPLRREMADFGSTLGQGEFFRVAPPSMSFEQLLPATDMGLLTPAGPVATLPIAVVMAAGLPIVSTVTSTVAELLEDRHNCLMVAGRTPRQIARRVMDLRENDNLQWAISDMARTEAFDYFPRSRFVEQIKSLYEQVVAGGNIELPLPRGGVGARFHGRA